ncbi:hypothetical protein D9M72_237800 [compost metagenome]
MPLDKALLTSASAASTVPWYAIMAWSRCADAVCTWPRMAPPWKIGWVRPAPMPHTRDALSHSPAGELAMAPKRPLRLTAGRYSACAAPSCALAAMAACSACSTSGRRDSSAAGRSAPIDGGCSSPTGLPRSIGPGSRPSSTDSAFSVCAMPLRSTGMVASVT